jgi:hypothetical protein
MYFKPSSAPEMIKHTGVVPVVKVQSTTKKSHSYIWYLAYCAKFRKWFKTGLKIRSAIKRYLT